MLVVMAWRFRVSVKSSLVNWLPWSVLKISGLPYWQSACSSASTQKSVPSVFDSRHASTESPLLPLCAFAGLTYSFDQAPDAHFTAPHPPSHARSAAPGASTGNWARISPAAGPPDRPNADPTFVERRHAVDARVLAAASYRPRC